MNRVLFTIAMLLTPVCARPPAAQFGPRVSLSGELPLSTALLRLGRQLNRRFWGPPLNRSETARRSYAWHLDNATVADTLDAIRQTTGFEVRRGSRYYYQLDEQGPRGSIGQPLGDFRVWLPAVRMFFSSYLYPAYADRVYQRLSVSPLFLVEAPCDPEALRIHDVGNPSLMLPDGQEGDNQPTRRMMAEQPTLADPATWQFAPYLDLPDPTASELLRLSLDVTFARSLDELRFDFPLGGGGPPMLTDGDYDASLTPPAPRARSFAITLNGPKPADVVPNDVTNGLRRHLWVEGRLYDETGEALFTDTRFETVSLADPQWSSRWRFDVLAPDGSRLPTRLEVRVYVPGDAGETERVVFEHVPLPRLFGDGG